MTRFYFMILVGGSFFTHNFTYSMHINKVPVVLPAKLWERIVRFMPGDNLYRALWSRCHNASQEFYDEIIYAYLQSHFVPSDLVQITVDKHFLFFKGSVQEQIDFKEKIIAAFGKYTNADTQKYRQYIANVTHSKDLWDIPISLSNQRMKRIVTLLSRRAKERVLLKEQLGQTGEHIRVIRDIKKLLSCIVCYKQFFRSISIKLAFIRALNETKNWFGEHGSKLQAVFALCIVHVLPMFAFVDKQKQENIVATTQVFIALLLFVTLAKYGTRYICDELIDYVYDQHLLRIDYLEDIQKKLTALLHDLK